MSQLRLTSGQYRGRMIHVPKGRQTRPTQARLRQALFNSLQIYLPGALVLDLFAGSGALGFEALSRDVSHVTFVENDKKAGDALHRNFEELKLGTEVRHVMTSVESLWLDERIAVKILNKGPFDLILADPPYEEGYELKVLQRLDWSKYLKTGGHFCLEWGRQKSQVDGLPEMIGNLVKVREKVYGESVLTTYESRNLSGVV